MSKFLASGDSVPEAHSLLVKALEELKIANDYNYALLLGFFSIELVVSDVLHHVKEKAGISNNTLKQYESEYGCHTRSTSSFLWCSSRIIPSASSFLI